VQTDLDEGAGVHRYRFNHHRYVTSESFDAAGPRPITFDYDRDPATNVVNRVTLTCGADTRTVTRPMAEVDFSTMDAMVRETCRP
jgi:hypothetical protein